MPFNWHLKIICDTYFYQLKSVQYTCVDGRRTGNYWNDESGFEYWAMFACPLNPNISSTLNEYYKNNIIYNCWWNAVTKTKHFVNSGLESTFERLWHQHELFKSLRICLSETIRPRNIFSHRAQYKSVKTNIY